LLFILHGRNYIFNPPQHLSLMVVLN
jgi:hypothetical protein